MEIKSETIIIEVRGGAVQEVYTNAENLNVVLLDWDKGESPGDDYAGGRVQPALLSAMPSESLAAIFALTLPDGSPLESR